MKVERKNILSRISVGHFIGRDAELEQILNHGRVGTKNLGLLVLSATGNGCSELLQQAYDQLFQDQGEIIPVYFSLNPNHKTTIQAARSFLQTFLLQVVAFRRNDLSLISSSPEICEIAEKAIPGDALWIDRLVSSCEMETKLEDESSFVRNCLSSPLRAQSQGAKSLIIIDNLHLAANLFGEISFIEELKEILSRAEIPFILAGKRRFVLSAIQTGNTKLANVDVLRLQELTVSDASLLVEYLAKSNGVKINNQTRDLMIQQFHCNPLFINSIFASASEKKIDLDSFQKLEKLYVDELFGGKFGKIFDTIFDEISPNSQVQRQIIGLLYDSLTANNGKSEIEAWRRRLNVSESDFSRIINCLNTYEVILLNNTIIEVKDNFDIVSDYIKLRFRLEILSEPRVLVFADFLAENLKRAPVTMANFYRKTSALGLRELLAVFNCQELPEDLFDYSKFKANLKGLEDAEIIAAVSENKKLKLPQIIYTASCGAFYPQIEQISDKERCSVALGFDYGTYLDENEIVWLVAEVDSKLEASKDLTEFWCDRLEIVALMCNFTKYKIWLITPEGFTNEASEVLLERNAFGSSRKQIELLVSMLNVENVVKPRLKSNEYEMIVPMGDDTELISAHAIEEIAKRHNFSAKAINQIKTALVEACINATEHSHSPDGKIYQKFVVEDDKIVITISNRGVKMSKPKPIGIEPNEGRRGWGLKLMKSLMDEVVFQQVDDGTSILMTKYLAKPDLSVIGN
jgi:serine/threonine-protein kinase RsbW